MLEMQPASNAALKETRVSRSVPGHEDEIRNFIVGTLLFGEGGVSLAETDSLLAMGILDSMGVLDLVAFLERTFGITVEDSEIVPENLDSIERMNAFVLRKKGGI